MSQRWVLVDGYSVLHTWKRLQKPPGRSLQHYRDALLRLLRQYGDHSGCRVTVVFDGYAAKRKPETTEPSPGVEVIYSEQGKTADDIIERLVAQAQERANILVVTSDNVERHTVEAMGAHSMSAGVFEAQMEAALKDLAALVRRHGRRRRIGSMWNGLQE